MPARTPWRFALSSTMRGIYVIRLFLFAGGVGILGGLLERTIGHTDRPILGLALGLAVGLVAFRGQLKPLRWPRLYLSQTSLHLVQRRQVVTLPWQAIRAASASGAEVAVQLATPMIAPDGQPAEAIQLEARKFGEAASSLAEALTGLIS